MRRLLKSLMQVLIQCMVQALFELRDALVNASLLLQDIEFQIDLARRMEAARDSNALIERVRSF